MGDRSIELAQVTYQGPPLDDEETLEALPEDFITLLKQINGFVLFEGGFHVRGACISPEWHSLRAIWHGKDALHRHYRNVTESDIPFAQEATGDQFLLRSESVIRLWSETGEVKGLGLDLRTFLDSVRRDPVKTLSLEPFLEFQRQGGALRPGELLGVVPPFCIAESAQGVSYRAIPAHDRLGFLADLARQLDGNLGN
jgi:hypothetical protein